MWPKFSGLQSVAFVRARRALPLLLGALVIVASGCTNRVGVHLADARIELLNGSERLLAGLDRGATTEQEFLQAWRAFCEGWAGPNPLILDRSEFPRNFPESNQGTVICYSLGFTYRSGVGDPPREAPLETEWVVHVYFDEAARVLSSTGYIAEEPETPWPSPGPSQ